MKMKFMKNETLITIALIIGFLILIGLNSNVTATTTQNFNGPNSVTVAPKNTESSNSNSMFELVGGDTTSTNTNTNTNTNAVDNNTNKSGQLANTGLEDLPYLLITILAISAIFAYKKIEEYKSI